MMSENPLADALSAAVAPAVAAEVHSQLATLEARLSALEDQLVSASGPAADALRRAALGIGADLAGDLEHDPQTQRIAVLGTLGACLAAGLIILIAALAGNHLAADWIGGAPALVAAGVLWISNTGANLPGKTTLRKTPSPAQSPLETK
jgi:hypothetical protein